ncbi:aspartyl-phosphate phosphatase Spo0E family protein [Paenibacillus sp. Soil724D2]|uniref:aspartyl-phosphate phosphatase Spo0E family protein n=1 Tax=Paenibacillus sp. (strain Soil724D2) TaxID=1736392 RepID=UPI00138F701A|nr:aspartyl-phosphate phosphatase Spo0E family protein [Paenibacillus sp. Soil724D2]
MLCEIRVIGGRWVHYIPAPCPRFSFSAVTAGSSRSRRPSEGEEKRDVLMEDSESLATMLYELRQKLNRIANNNNYDLQNPEVLALSEAIDELIILFIKMRDG